MLAGNINPLTRGQQSGEGRAIGQLRKRCIPEIGRARASHLGNRIVAAAPGLLLWLNTAAKLRASLLTSERGMAGEEMTVRPEDTLRAAGSSTKRQEKYQRRMSSLLAGRPAPPAARGGLRK
jgi:hypothetical protein